MRRAGRLAISVVTVLAMLGAAGLMIRHMARGLVLVPHAVNLEPGATPIPLSQDGTTSLDIKPPLLGFSVPTFPPDTTELATLRSATGVAPKVVVIYQRFGAPFNLTAATRLRAIGAMTLIQLDPDAGVMRPIVAGQFDGQLRTYARQVRDFGGPVGIGFGHEFNGPWFRWSFRKVPAPLFVAVWRHLHDVFTQAGARNVIWVWTINRENAVTTRLAPYWPGDGYVGWVGVDGYIFPGRRGFDDVFLATIRDVRALTRRPILITETAVAIMPGRERLIRDLFAGLARTKKDGVIGLIWFDYRRDKSHDWRIDQDPAALAAFRQAAARFRKAYG